jgi:hypothetical protein
MNTKVLSTEPPERDDDEPPRSRGIETLLKKMAAKKAEDAKQD